MKITKLSLIILIPGYIYAQKDVVNQEINITKDKEVSVAKANKVMAKGQILPHGQENKKMTYTFFERKPKEATESKFEPAVINPETSNAKNKEELNAYQNHAKIGFGNFGRVLGELYLNTDQNKNFIAGITFLHNSIKRGPVKSDFSANRSTKIGFDGKYHKNNFKINAETSYENQRYYFYGYDTLANSDYTKNQLEQRVNLFKFSTNFENTNPKAKVDFNLKTGVNFLDDYYSASELDWGTVFNSYFPIQEDRVIATLNAEAYLTERTDNFDDNPTRKRNLYRVEPGFLFEFGKISAKIGFKAVNEYDQILKINKTKGFPTALLSYKTPSLTYFYVGYDGDIIRNTLHSMQRENPFLREQLDLQNTYKNSDIFLGARGELYSGFTFNTKISYGKYQNLYFFNAYDGSTFAPDGVPIVATKFQVDYEDSEAKTDFVQVGTEFGYQNFDNWKSNLKLEYNYFETVKFNAAYLRPAFTGRFGNTFTFSNKLVAHLDYYLLTGLKAREPISGEAVKLKDINDLNAEMTYLFSKQISAFVKLNNIFGQNYQRYYFYPQLGLNFVAGVNLAL